jgi:hypothetical protein
MILVYKILNFRRKESSWHGLSHVPTNSLASGG